MQTTHSTSEQLTEVLTIVKEIRDQHPLKKDWISRPDLMKFFNYGPTQMAELEKSGKLRVAKVGKRKFYAISSVNAMLEQAVKANEEQEE